MHGVLSGYSYHRHLHLLTRFPCTTHYRSRVKAAAIAIAHENAKRRKHKHPHQRTANSEREKADRRREHPPSVIQTINHGAASTRGVRGRRIASRDRKSTRLNSSH